MYITDERWEIFEMYLELAIDYFESYEKMDFEQATLRDQLQEILFYSPKCEDDCE